MFDGGETDKSVWNVQQVKLQKRELDDGKDKTFTENRSAGDETRDSERWCQRSRLSSLRSLSDTSVVRWRRFFVRRQDSSVSSVKFQTRSNRDEISRVKIKHSFFYLISEADFQMFRFFKENEEMIQCDDNKINNMWLTLITWRDVTRELISTWLDFLRLIDQRSEVNNNMIQKKYPQSITYDNQRMIPRHMIRDQRRSTLLRHDERVWIRVKSCCCYWKFDFLFFLF